MSRRNIAIVSVDTATNQLSDLSIGAPKLSKNKLKKSAYWNPAMKIALGTIDNPMYFPYGLQGPFVANVQNSPIDEMGGNNSLPMEMARDSKEFQYFEQRDLKSIEIMSQNYNAWTILDEQTTRKDEPEVAIALHLIRAKYNPIVQVKSQNGEMLQNPRFKPKFDTNKSIVELIRFNRETNELTVSPGTWHDITKDSKGRVVVKNGDLFCAKQVYGEHWYIDRVQIINDDNNFEVETFPDDLETNRSIVVEQKFGEDNDGENSHASTGDHASGNNTSDEHKRKRGDYDNSVNSVDGDGNDDQKRVKPNDISSSSSSPAPQSQKPYIQAGNFFRAQDEY